MKKRILASTMASVMALSAAGTSLVSSAAVSDDWKQSTVTKAELRAFIESKEVKELIDGKIQNYGSVSGTNFQKAVDYAYAVLDDYSAADSDYTAAFLIVKSTINALTQYDSKELSALVESLRPIYATNNELNEDDSIYTQDSWGDFASAYETADAVKDSSDILVTTDAYEELYKVRNPEALEKKTKLQIARAKEAYERAMALEYAYQPWQRGTVKASGTDYNNRQFAWGTLYAHVKGAGNTGATATALRNQYNLFNNRENVKETTDPAIIAAVDAMEEVAAVLNGFTPDSVTSGGSERNVTTLLTNYHGQLLYTYGDTTKIEAAVSNFIATAASAAAAASKDDGAVSIMNGSKWNDSGDLDLSDKSEYWQITESAAKAHKPLSGAGRAPSVADVSTQDDYEYSYISGSTTSNNKTNALSGNSVIKVIDAKLQMKSEDYELWYIIDKDPASEMTSGKAPIVEATTGVYFYATKAEATTEMNKLAGKAKMQVLSTGKNKSFTLSDLMDFSLTDVATALVSDWGATASQEDEFNFGVWNDVVDVPGEIEFDTDENGLSVSGIVFDGTGTGTNDFVLTNAYDSLKSTGNDSDIVTANILKALTLYDEFRSGDWTNIIDLDNRDTISAQELTNYNSGSNTRIPNQAWNMLYWYLKYALEDQFVDAEAAKFTKTDIQNLIDKAYKIGEETIETTLFECSHKRMVNQRETSWSWMKEANADRAYKNYTSSYTGGTSSTRGKALNDAISDVQKEMAAFAYSYGDITEKMAEIAKAIDEGKLSASDVKKLTADLDAVGLAFVNLETAVYEGRLTDSASRYDLEGTEVFNDDGTMNKNNRLFTNGSKFNGIRLTAAPFSGNKAKVCESKGENSANHTHYVMQTAYEKLVKDYEAATTTPEVKITNDVNGDGEFTMADLTEMLKLYANGNRDASKYDFDGNGKVELADITKLLQNYINR